MKFALKGLQIAYLCAITLAKWQHILRELLWFGLPTLRLQNINFLKSKICLLQGDNLFMNLFSMKLVIVSNHKYF